MKSVNNTELSSGVTKNRSYKRNICFIVIALSVVLLIAGSAVYKNGKAESGVFPGNDIISYEKFITTNEFKGLSEFRQYYAETYGDYMDYCDRWYCPPEISMIVYGNADKQDKIELQEVAEKYSLNVPNAVETINGNNAYERTNQHPFCDRDLTMHKLYDNGAFEAEGRDEVAFSINFIPKGSLYTNSWHVGFNPYGETESWLYTTEKGDNVLCVKVWPEDWIIYENDQAYVIVLVSDFNPDLGETPVDNNTRESRLEKTADIIAFGEIR